jgi:hypothetical protein
VGDVRQPLLALVGLFQLLTFARTSTIREITSVSIQRENAWVRTQ